MDDEVRKGLHCEGGFLVTASGDRGRKERTLERRVSRLEWTLSHRGWILVARFAAKPAPACSVGGLQRPLVLLPPHLRRFPPVAESHLDLRRARLSPLGELPDPGFRQQRYLLEPPPPPLQHRHFAARIHCHLGSGSSGFLGVSHRFLPDAVGEGMLYNVTNNTTARLAYLQLEICESYQTAVSETRLRGRN